MRSKILSSLVVCFLGFSAAVVAPPQGGSVAVAASTSAFTPVQPARLLDTRPSATVDGRFSNGGRLTGGQALKLDVAGRGGVPSDAVAAALNLTVTGPSAPGFLTAYPCGSPMPTTSNVNFAAGQTVANLSIVKLGSGGTVCLVADQSIHLIVDVTAFSAQAATITPLVPARLFDTRRSPTADGLQSNVGRLGRQQTVEINVAGRVGVPGDASLAALNLTVTNPQSAGFVTAYPCGQAPPNASTLNFRAGQTVANLALVKIGVGGRVCVVSDQPTDLIADVSAFTPATTSVGSLSPARLLDTRRSATVDGRYSGIDVLRPNVITELPVTGRAGVPLTAATASLNLTIVDPLQAGFLTAYPCGSPRPNTSNVNFVAGETIANLSLMKLGQGGSICIVADQTTHVIVDVTAYDAGDPPMPPAASAGARVGGCPMRPPSDPWNQTISGLQVHPQSATWVGSVGAGRSLHPDFGADPTYGIPFTVVPESQPPVAISFTSYADESDPSPYPLPNDAPIEAGSDAHVLVVQQGSCKLYELGNASRRTGQWQASGGAVFDLTTTSYRPETWTSADAAGLPILPGLVRYEEVKSGVITHALRFTAPATQRGYILPARHFAGSASPNLPPMGARFRLRADYDISRFHGDALVIATALKTYGLILADNGSSWFVSGATDPRWNDEDLNQLKSVPGSAFDVVDTGATTTG